jgi:predicted nucleic acid-binding protein
VSQNTVIDASALAAVIFDEPERDDVLRSIDGLSLHAPYLLQSEMANITVKKIRRRPDQTDHYLFALNRIQTVEIAYHALEEFEVPKIALQFGLWAYDASYLWLALHLGASLTTLDKRLAAAAATVMQRP